MSSIGTSGKLNPSVIQGNIFRTLASIASNLRDTVAANPSILIGIVVSLYLSQIAYYIFLHPYSKIPGPFLASFSKLWITSRYFRGSWHDDVLELHRRYGPVVRITPDQVSFVDRNALKTLYGHGTGTNKGPWYGTWGSVGGSGRSVFGTQDPAIHKFLRGRVSPAYAMSSVLTMEPFIQEVADKCWAKFQKYAGTGQHIDLSQWVSYFTFDVIGQLAMGGELGFLQKEEDVDSLISSIHSGTGLQGNLGYVPLQTWWFFNSGSQWLLEHFAPAELQAFPNFIKWLSARVDDRMKTGLGGRRRDMLQQFIEMKGSDLSSSPSPTKEEVRLEAVVTLGAGADTTSYAIQGVLGDIIMHPNILPKIQKEVDEAYRDLGLADNGAEILYNDATKLPYLAAVIKESMRLSPSFVYQMQRCTPEKGIEIGAHHLPGGLYVGISPCAMNRSKEIFGEDADDFVPERWLPSRSNSEESIKEMNRLLTTFGMGSRICIGQNIALVEVYKFAAQFVRHFELESVKKDRPWTTRSSTFAFRSDFWVKLKAR